MPKRIGKIRTIRRADAEAGVSLLKRRAWYAEDDGSDDPEDDGGDETPPEDADDVDGNIDDLPKWAQKVIYDTRSEAKKRRKEVGELRDVQRKREQKRLHDQGEFKQLAADRLNEITELTAYKDRFETLESMITSSNEQRVEDIPETLRSIVPVDYAPDKLATWLDANANKLTTPNAPDFNAGEGGGSGDREKPVKLDAQQEKMIAESGMDRAKYIARLQARKENK